MHSKSLLIAIAALALTATGAQAFTGDALIQAGLTDSQLAAFEVARELREEGDSEAARDVLFEAGIDESVLERVRAAMTGERQAYHAAIDAAVEANDFEAFMVAIADSPLADIITNEVDFDRFKEAYTLREAGDKAAATAIMSELGVDTTAHHINKFWQHHGPLLAELTDEQSAAFTVARMANNREAMHAIFEEAGLNQGTRPEGPRHLRDGRELD